MPKKTEKREEVSIAPPQRWVKRTPSSCGKVWKKCWASVANVGSCSSQRGPTGPRKR